MKIQIKKYRTEKVEASVFEFELPSLTSYYLQKGLHKIIRIAVITDEKPQEFKITVGSIKELKLEKFKIRLAELEEVYYGDYHPHMVILMELILGSVQLQQISEQKFNDDIALLFQEITN